LSAAAEVTVAGRRLEVVDRPGDPERSALVFLHEGLGSVGLWRTFPARVADVTGRRAVLYSRAGYGASDPADLPRPDRYMHDEALCVLPAVLEHLEVRRPLLVGHSDGASIALIHAGSGRPVEGLVLIAPHAFVEERSLQGIRAAREAYLGGDLRERLARHHTDVDNAFWGWNDVWLSEPFRRWNIEEYLPRVQAPVLVVQGDADEYGTERQVEAIVSWAGGPVSVCIVPGAGHGPHLEDPRTVLDAVTTWIAGLPASGGPS